MNILDKNFKYTNAAKTDIRKTFTRVRRELATKDKSLDKPLVDKVPLVVKEPLVSYGTFKTLADFEEVLGVR